MHIISNQLVSRELEQVIENKQVHGTLIVDRKKVVIPFGNIWLKSSHGLGIWKLNTCLTDTSFITHLYVSRTSHFGAITFGFLYEGVKFVSSRFITYFAAILPITVSHALDNKQQAVI